MIDNQSLSSHNEIFSWIRCWKVVQIHHHSWVLPTHSRSSNESKWQFKAFCKLLCHSFTIKFLPWERCDTCCCKFNKWNTHVHTHAYIFSNSIAALMDSGLHPTHDDLIEHRRDSTACFNATDSEIIPSLIWFFDLNVLLMNLCECMNDSWQWQWHNLFQQIFWWDCFQDNALPLQFLSGNQKKVLVVFSAGIDFFASSQSDFHTLSSSKIILFLSCCFCWVFFDCHKLHLLKGQKVHLWSTECCLFGMKFQVFGWLRL